MEEKHDSWLDGISAVTLKSLLENPNMLMPTNMGRGNAGQSVKVKEKDFDKPDNHGSNLTSMSAFLGPKLWNNTLPDNDDLKFEYMDLDEFLNEHGITGSNEEGAATKTDGNANTSPQQASVQDKPSAVREDISRKPVGTDVATTGGCNASLTQSSQQNLSKPICEETEGNLPTIPQQLCPFPPECASQPFLPSPQASSPQAAQPHDADAPFKASSTDVALATAPGEQVFDPREKKFSDEELKPQPMIKKSRKVLVPDEQKDDKYWERRRKNNVAAKRSRDARRVKENQIVLRASFLETQNGGLKDELTVLKKENMSLKKLVSNLEKQIRAVHNGV